MIAKITVAKITSGKSDMHIEWMDPLVKKYGGVACSQGGTCLE